MIQVVLQEHIRSVRVDTRWQRELMCIVWYQETEEQEWRNEEQVQHVGKPVDNTTETPEIPVVLVTGRYIPWIDA